ncbi:MAG: AI-2E family transporter [Planctomycetota bacterium]
MESLLQKRGVRLTLLVLVFLGALYGAYQLSAIFAPLLFSFIVAYVLDPVADALERRKFTRLAAVVTIFTIGTVVSVLFLVVGGFFISQAVTRFAADLTSEPGYTEGEFGVRAVPDPRVLARLPAPVGGGDRFLDWNGNGSPDDGEPLYSADALAARIAEGKVRLVQRPVRSLEPESPFAIFDDENGNGVRDEGYLEQARNALVHLGDDLEGEISRGEPTRLVYSAVGEWLNEKQGPLSEGDPERTKARIQAYLDSLLPPFLRTRSAEDPAPVPEAPAGAPATLSAEEEPPPEASTLLGTLFTWGSWLLLCPLYIFYLLLEIDPLVERIRRYLPGRQRPRIERLLGSIDRTMAAFFRGRLTICVLKGLGTSLGLLALGVPFAFPLGLAAGFLALVPYIGIWFAIVPAALLSWLDTNSLGALLAVGGVFVVMETIEGFLLIPKLLGKEVGLHPLTVIVTMLIFSEILGFVGILLSVPLAAIAKILIAEFVMPLVEEFAAETPDAKEGAGA